LQCCVIGAKLYEFTVAHNKNKILPSLVSDLTCFTSCHRLS